MSTEDYAWIEATPEPEWSDIDWHDGPTMIGWSYGPAVTS